MKRRYPNTKVVIANAFKQYDKRTIIINALTNKYIYSGDVEKDVYYRDENQSLKKV